MLPDVVHRRWFGSYERVAKTYKLEQFGSIAIPTHLLMVRNACHHVPNNDHTFIYERKRKPFVRALISTYKRHKYSTGLTIEEARALMHEHNTDVAFLEEHGRVSGQGWVLVKLPHPMLWSRFTIQERLNTQLLRKIKAMVQCLTVGKTLYLPYELRAQIIYFLL